MSTTDPRSPAPEASTASGRVRGLWREGPGGTASAAFLGIPFAAAPVGELRFQAPDAVEPWEGVREATAPGPTPQRRPFGELTTIPEPSFPGEATLNVNVFTPAPGDREAALPVLVWIHGGGYFAGSPSSPWYDGRAFNRDGVVTVSISYRLGFDGFGWIDGGAQNRGVLDQIAALEWVQGNIRDFGGDPGRVTIAGQSAGGGSVLTLLAAPAASGLFAGAIAHSGAQSRLEPEAARGLAARLAERMGLPDASLESWRSVSEDAILDQQRSLDGGDGMPRPGSAAELVDGLAAGRTSIGGLSWAPVVDGEIVGADAVSRVPLLLGTTANEFAFPMPGATPADALAELERVGVGAEARDRLARELDAIGAAHTTGQLISEGMFRVPAVQCTAARVADGVGESTWLYDFRLHPEGRPASHCLELPFAWDLLDAEGVTAQLGARPPQDLADRMHSDWVAFIAGGECPWPAATADAAGAMVYDEHSAYAPDAYLLETQLLGLAR